MPETSPSLPETRLQIPQQQRERDTQAIIFSAIGLGILFGYYLIYILRRFNHGHFGDFPTFYHAARAVLAHGDPYVPVEGDLAYVYPPLLATLYTPLAYLSKINAARVMLPVHLAIVLTALFVAAKEMLERFNLTPTRAGLWATACVAALLAENDLRGELQAMETDVMMLLMFVLALRWLDRRPTLSGLALAFAFSIKYLSICFLPYLLLRRRWKAAGWMLVWTVILAILPAVVAGWDDNLRYLGVALRGLVGWVGKSPGSQPAASVHHLADLVSVSITSAIARYLRDYTSKPESFALVLASGIGLVLLCGVAIVYRQMKLPLVFWPSAEKQRQWPYRGMVGLEWIGILTVMLVFSPNTNTRHLSMAVFAYVPAVILLLVPKPGVPRWPLFIGVICMFVGFMLPIPNLSTKRFTHTYFVLGCASWSLLFMYATLLCVGLFWVRAGRTER